MDKKQANPFLILFNQVACKKARQRLRRDHRGQAPNGRPSGSTLPPQKVASLWLSNCPRPSGRNAATRATERNRLRVRPWPWPGQPANRLRRLRASMGANTASRLAPVPGTALAAARWPATDPCNGRCLSSVGRKRAPEAGQRHTGFPCLAFNLFSCGVVFNVWRCSVAAHQVRAGIIREKSISDGLAQFNGYVGHGVFQCRGSAQRYSGLCRFGLLRLDGGQVE